MRAEHLAPWCDRQGCHAAPDDTITVGMVPNPDGSTPWVHARCTAEHTPADRPPQLGLA